jgi:hypothetical protein
MQKPFITKGYRHKKTRAVMNCHASQSGSGSWIRTNDLQVMSLTSYRAAPSRINILSASLSYLQVLLATPLVLRAIRLRQGYGGHAGLLHPASISFPCADVISTVR